MNLRTISGGAVLSLLVLSGCSSDDSNYRYRTSQNPYLLRPQGELPAVRLNPGEEVAQVDTQTKFQDPAPEQDEKVQENPFQSPDITDVTPEVPPEAEPEQFDPAPEAKTLTYKVKKGDSLWKIATLHGVSWKTLAAENNLDAKKALPLGKVLNLPAGAFEKPDYDLLKQHKRPGKSKYNSGKTKSTPSSRPKGGKYTVKSGDNLWTIPGRFGVKRSSFMKANGFSKTTVLQVGQKVIIPGKSDSDIGSSSSSGSRSQKSNTSSNAVASGDTYTVKKGDNLWTIPKKLKVKRADFLKVNNFSKDTVLQIGQKVKVPGKGGASSFDVEPNPVDPLPEDPKDPGFDPDFGTDPKEGSDTTAGGDTTTGGDAGKEEPAVEVGKGADADIKHKSYTLDISEGDKLEDICDLYSVSLADILKANPSVKSNADLKPGMKLIIPFKE